MNRNAENKGINQEALDMLLMDLKGEEDDNLNISVIISIKLKEIKEEHEGKFIFCNIEYWKEKQ